MWAVLKPQIDMWSETRKRILERHDFYIAQTKARVLANFADIAGDAEKFARTEYDRLGAKYSEEPDHAAEWAYERGQQFGALLDDLRKQTFLGALAGCFHQWDKELRGFLEHELLHNDFDAEGVQKKVWHEPVFDILLEIGWDCRTCAFFPLIDACSLIVNVHKHGKGPSLERLNKLFPVYLHHPLGAATRPWSSKKSIHHEWMEISEAQFEEITSALRQFWQQFPERLRLV
jgi:hypothetical protein